MRLTTSDCNATAPARVLPGVKPFRFGVLAEGAQTTEQLHDTAHRAEDAGFSTLLIRDHLVEDPFPHQLGPLTALAAVAAATRTLRVGTLVIGNDFRHPAVLAKEVATLDVLSGGRVELGLGAGFLRRDYAAAGLHMDEPRDRVGRLEEALRLLKALFGPDPVTHHGQYYTVEDLDTFPKPVQRPHPPLQVAAARPRMLAIAAREADIVSLQTVSTAGGVLTDDPAGRSPGAVADQTARIREAAGERFDRLELGTTATVVVTDDPISSAGQLASLRGWCGVTAQEVLQMPSIFIGPLQHLGGLFHERRAAYGLSYFVVSDGALEMAAPLVASLVTAAAP